MVVFDLSCAAHHRFELWVPSAAALDEQIAKGWVSCPYCGSKTVQRLPAAPAVVRRSRPAEKEPGTPPSSSPHAEAEALLARWWQALRTLQQRAEDVGARFPEEARRIHAGEAPERPIKGEAKRDEVMALLEEGVLVVPLPPELEEVH